MLRKLVGDGELRADPGYVRVVVSCFAIEVVSRSVTIECGVVVAV